MHAGSYGRALLDGEGEGLAVEPWQVALAIGFTPRGPALHRQGRQNGAARSLGRGTFARSCGVVQSGPPRRYVL